MHGKAGTFTLEALTPDYAPAELGFPRFLSSARNHGSYRLPLRQITKLPELTRRYVPGDPVNKIDWKAYGRTDQLLVREIVNEAMAKVTIVVDISATMNWPQDISHERKDSDFIPQGIPPKKAIALRLALNLAYAHLNRGDHVTVMLYRNEHSAFPDGVLSVKNAADVMSLYSLEAPFAFANIERFVETKDIRYRQSDHAYAISDGLSAFELDPFFRFTKTPVFIHVLSSLELNIGWAKDHVSYFDEGEDDGFLKEFSGHTLKNEHRYDAELKQWQAALAGKMNRIGGLYECFSDTSTIESYAVFLRSMSH